MGDFKRADIVQVKPPHHWGGCLVVVTEPKSFGIQGFVQIPKGGRAYIRLESKDIEKVGEAIWMPKDETDDE